MSFSITAITALTALTALTAMTAITKLAQEVDITLRANLFYEALGLLNPARGPRKVAASCRR